MKVAWHGHEFSGMEWNENNWSHEQRKPKHIAA